MQFEMKLRDQEKLLKAQFAIEVHGYKQEQEKYQL
jgi:hypothetical protein